ncbi:MAG: hypothetical protein KIT40_00825 [Nitrospira sp.]|nr:hypothetical protein [Nitrospira sp.]
MAYSVWRGPEKIEVPRLIVHGIDEDRIGERLFYESGDKRVFLKALMLFESRSPLA